MPHAKQDGQMVMPCPVLVMYWLQLLFSLPHTWHLRFICSPPNFLIPLHDSYINLLFPHFSGQLLHTSW